MKVSEVKYNRKFNNGNYEAEEFGITMVLDEDETASDAFKQCQEEVKAARSDDNNGGKTNEPAETTQNRRTGKSANKKGKGSQGDDDGSGKIEGEEEETETETEKGEDDEGDDKVPENEEEEQDPPPGKKSTPSGKKFNKKPQAYSRENKAHKDIFASILREVAPKWKDTPKSTAKGRKASTDLEGEDFLDAEGEVLPSFRLSVKKAMK